jgi:hypothetical protein
MHPAEEHLAKHASEQHGVFTYQQALDSGLSVHQVDRRAASRWTRLHEGVFRVKGAVPTWKGDLLAACLAAGDPVGVSHRAAAQIYEIPGRRELIEVTCRRWLRTQAPGLLVHESTRFGHEDITIVDGIPVSIPERVVLELAGLKPFPNFVEAVIHALRRKRLITYESTHAVFERLARPGVRGVKAMRLALEHWNPASRATASEMETLLLHVLRSAGLPEPVLQYTVYDDNGQFVADVDAGLPQWRITIEYDSKQEHSDEFQIAKDARRRDEILAAGFFPLTARHGDLLRGGDELVDRILRLSRRTCVTEPPTVGE